MLQWLGYYVFLLWVIVKIMIFGFGECFFDVVVLDWVI